MSDPKTANFGAEFKAMPVTGGRLVAAGAGDATALVGAGVDRKGYGSGKIIIAGHCNNTAAQKLQLTSVKIAYAPDNGSGAPGAYGADAEQLTASYDLCVGTGNAYGSYELDVDFTAKDQWCRVTYTPDSTAGATDVAETTAVLCLGGSQASAVQPVSRSA